MRDELGLFFFGLIFLMIGAALLNNGMSEPRTSEVASILAGATFLSFGLIIFWTVARNLWEWKKESRRYRDK